LKELKKKIDYKLISNTFLLQYYNLIVFKD